MKRAFGEKFERLLTALRREMPLKKPVRVIAVTRECLKHAEDRRKSCYGECETDGSRYLIRINHNKPADSAIDTLLHEWAHCHAPIYANKTSHTDEWGVAYAKAYRVWETIE